MVPMARQAVVPGAAFGSMAPGATGDARHQHVRRVATAPGRVTLRTGHRRVLPVIEWRMEKPAVRNDRLRDPGRRVAGGRHLMTIGAALENRHAIAIDR